MIEVDPEAVFELAAQRTLDAIEAGSQQVPAAPVRGDAGSTASALHPATELPVRARIPHQSAGPSLRASGRASATRTDVLGGAAPISPAVTGQERLSL